MIQRNIENGYGTVTKAAMLDQNLTIEAKAIYAYLCSFAGGKDNAWPSVSRICYDLKISENRFHKHIKHLINNEYIKKTRQRWSDSKQFAGNIYRILK